MKKVLFACIRNAGRSQMAAAFFNAEADPTLARAISAGTEPASRLHSTVVEAMREVGIDVSDRVPSLLTAEVGAEAEYLVTMGCGDACPVVPHSIREAWDLEDPAGKSIARVRLVRDDIRERVRDLIGRYGWERATPERRR